jgi:hypothetical protein
MPIAEDFVAAWLPIRELDCRGMPENQRDLRFDALLPGPDPSPVPPLAILDFGSSAPIPAFSMLREYARLTAH